MEKGSGAAQAQADSGDDRKRRARKRRRAQRRRDEEDKRCCMGSSIPGGPLASGVERGMDFVYEVDDDQEANTRRVDREDDEKGLRINSWVAFLEEMELFANTTKFSESPKEAKGVHLKKSQRYT